MKSIYRAALMFGVVIPLAFVFLRSAGAQDQYVQQTNSEQKTSTPESLDVQYARKRLEIAKTDLALAMSQNRRITNENNKLFIKRLESQVVLAESELASTLEGKKLDVHRMHINQLESAVDLAKNQLQWTREINKKIPGFYQTEILNRSRLEVELKEIELERAKKSKVTRTPIDHLQWQIEQLQSEIRLMRLQLERVRSAR